MPFSKALILFALCCFPFCEQVFAVVLGVEGEIRHQLSTSKSSVTYQYHMVVSNECWQIAMKGQLKPQLEVNNYLDSFDGTNTFSLIVVRRQGQIVASQLSVTANKVPVGRSHRAIPIWLAFVSGQLLTNNSPSHLKPFFERPTEDVPQYDVDYGAEWIQSSVPPGIPLELTLRQPRLRYLSGQGGRLIPRTLDSSVAQAPVETFYKASIVTNFSEMVLPLEFCLTRYASIKRSPEGTLESAPAAEYYGRVVSLTTNIPFISFRPKLEARTLVEDRRFALSNPPVKAISYQASNSIPDVTNRFLVQAYRRLARIETAQLGSKRGDLSTSKKIFLTVLICFNIVVAVSVLSLWKKWEKPCFNEN